MADNLAQARQDLAIANRIGDGVRQRSRQLLDTEAAIGLYGHHWHTEPL